MSQRIKVPTDRSFGFTFAVIFALVGTWFAWNASRWGVPLLAAAAVFALAAALIPKSLHPLNVLWMRFGLFLNMIVSPIVLGAIFFGFLTPVALFFRLRGRDVLYRSFEKQRSSYWFDRDPPGPDASSFPRQF